MENICVMNTNATEYTKHTINKGYANKIKINREVASMKFSYHIFAIRPCTAIFTVCNIVSVWRIRNASEYTKYTINKGNANKIKITKVAPMQFLYHIFIFILSGIFEILILAAVLSDTVDVPYVRSFICYCN